MYVIFF